MAGGFSKKMGFRLKCLSDGAEHENTVEQGFITAFQKGYSVIEIARVAGMKSAKYVHAALVKHGQIASAKPGRQSKNIVLPEGFDAQLKVRELSFAQWCAGWSFDQSEALEGIRSLSGPVVTAVKRDFPGYYGKLTGAQVDDYATGPEFERTSFNVTFDWDGLKGCYKAEIAELGICAYGDTYPAAFHLALIRKKHLTALSRLDKLPNLSGGGVDW